MKVLWIITFSLLSIGSFSQTPGFKFGPRLGIGVSEFTKLPEKQTPSIGAVQIGLTARRQLTTYFAIEFCPLFGEYGSRMKGIEYNANYTGGRQLGYTYRDDFHVGVVEFPLLARFSVGIKHNYLSAFLGPSICVEMFGIHSRTYDDEQYNFDHGFTGVSIRELYDGCYAGVFGMGIEREMKKGNLGFDLRLHHLLTPMGKIEGSKFYVETITLGTSWIF